MLKSRSVIYATTQAIILVFVLCFGVLFRGLFYEPEQLAAIWILSLTVLLVARSRGPAQASAGLPSMAMHGALVGHLLDLAPQLLEMSALGLPVLYLISVLWSPSAHAALLALLVVSSGGFAFIIARGVREPTRLLRWVMWGLGLSAFIAAAGGLLADMGLVSIPGAVVEGYRVSSFFQYPDAFAAFAMVGVFCLIGMAVERGGSLASGAGTAAGFVVFVGFFLAASRGAFLVFPIVFCLVLWLLPKTKVVNSLILLTVAGLAAILVLRGFVANVAIHDVNHAFQWLASGGVLSAFAGGSWPWVSRRRGWLRRDRILLGASVLVVLLAGFGLAVLTLHLTPGSDLARAATSPSRFVSALLPSFLSIRTSAITVEASAAAQRLIYYADTLSALASHPLGLGTGAWPSVFGHIERFYYVGRNVHSQVLQVAVDAGIPGLVAYVIFWLTLLSLTWRARLLLDDDGRLALGATASGAVALGLHGTIDFTLSYLALYLIIMIIAGAIAGLAANRDGDKRPRILERVLTFERRVVGWLAAVALLLAPLMLVSSVAAGRGLSHLEAGHMPEAQADYEIAARFEPWSAPARLGLARSTLARSRGGDATPEMAHEAVRQAQLAVRFDRALSGGYGTLAEALLNLPDGSPADAKEAVAAAEKAVAYQKYRPVYYPTLGEAYVTLALRTADDVERTLVLGQLTDLVATVARRQAEIEPYQRLFRYPQVSMVPELALRVGQGYLLNGDFAAAAKYLSQAEGDRALIIPSEVWLYRLYQLTGARTELKRLEAKPWILFADQNPEFQRLRELTAKYEKKGGK